MINSRGNSDLTLTTMTEIHDLNLTDTEYAALATQGYDPHLEHLMIQVGKDPDEARKLTRVVGLTRISHHRQRRSGLSL